MDGRDGRSGRSRGEIEQLHLRLPLELVLVLKVYQIGYHFPTLNAAAKHLFETHPELTGLASEIYNIAKHKPTVSDRPE